MSTTHRNCGIDIEAIEKIFAKCVMNAALIIAADGEIITVNNAFTRCFGYSSEDISGKHFSILFTPEAKRSGIPEKELRKLFDQGQANDENFILHKNGSQISVTGEAVLITQGKQKFILKIIQEIRLHKTLDRQPPEINNLTENILSSMDDIVVVMDEHLDILKANRIFYDLFKNDLPQRDISFAGLVERYDELSIVVKNLTALSGNGKAFKDLPIELKIASGTRIFYVNGSTMNLDNDRHNLLLVMHDITLQKNTEREKEDLIGFVAHELRNPLSNIVLCNELMDDMVQHQQTAEIHDLLERNKRNVLRLTRMIEELYDTASFRSGNYYLAQSWFDFDDMVRHSVETMQALHPGYNLRLNGKAAVKIWADEHRLMQVMTNYLGNAIKYSAGSRDVLVNVITGSDSVTVAVIDKGIGIAADQLPHIFKRFFRASKARKIEGIGLGLYLCCRIVEAHHGKVWADSEEGKGSTFYFSIPVDRK